MEILIESIAAVPTIVLPDWLNWCRLCGKHDLGQSAIKHEAVGDLTFTIQKHFSISLSSTDNCTVSSICIDCFNFVGKLERFAGKCVKVESVFNKILSSNTDLQHDADYLRALRCEFGLDDDEKYPTECQDKTTDTLDLLADASVSGRKGQRRRSTPRTRKPKKIEPEDFLVDEEEIEAEFLVNNDDIENDPSFDMDGFDYQDSSDNNDDSMEEMTDSIIVSELEVLQPTAKRRKRRPVEAGPFKCPICDKEFEKKRQFDIHMRNSHSTLDKPFVCGQCPKGFDTLKKLNIHESVHLPDDLKYVHPCQFCDKRFSKIVNVQAHIRAIHTGDRPFICEECGKSFVAKGGLKEHQMTHSNEFPIQCPHCPKRFKNIARLRIHEDIHKHTNYICPHCGLQLNTKRTLKMHLVVHSEVKKFKCQYCGNEYKRSKTLKNHLIIHTGLRPYTCPWCDKTFANGSNCRSHKKKAHPAELAALEASGLALPAVTIPKLDQLQPN